MPSEPDIVAAAESDAGVDVSLKLLDGFELAQDGEAVELPLGAQRLLAFLALHDRPLTRIYVAGTLWLDTSEERSRANLRAALWRLRQPGATVVEASSTHVRLGRNVVVDVRSLVAAAHRVLSGAADGAAPEADRAETCLSGELLPDWYDNWVLEERERLRQLRLHALESLAERLADAGLYGQAIQAALDAVRTEPLRESAQRALIRVHLAEGNYAEALQCYRAYKARLRDELGLAPSPQMEELVEGLEGRPPRRGGRRSA